MKKMMLCILCSIFFVCCMTSCNFFEVLEMPDDYVANYPEEETPEVITPREGGILTVASTQYTTLNPLDNTNFYMEEVLNLIYDGLVSLNNQMQAMPVLAEKLQPSADAREWTVSLRQNMIWHDGKYFSAEDVIHTVQLIQKNANHKYAHCVNNIISMEAMDAYTILFKLQNPDSFFAEKMFFPIVPKHTEVNNVQVGTGLYKFAEKSEKQLVLISYGMNATVQGKKVPYIPTIEVRFFENTTDVIYSDCDVVMVKGEDYHKISGKIGYSTKKYISTEYEVLAFNVTKNVLSDSAVRRAIAYAIDRDGAIDNFFKVESSVSDIPLPSACWIRASSQLFYSYDLEAAQKLLANKNYTEKQLTFTCLVNKENALRVKYANYFKKKLAEVGITLKIEEVTADVLTQKLSENQYDLALIGMNISQLDDLADYYGSNGVYNVSGYANGELDGLFTKLSGYIYENERKTIFSQI